MSLDGEARISYLGTNPSSDTPILSLILISIVFNSVMYYCLPSSLTPLIKNYIVGTIHAFISVLAVCIFFIRSTVNLTQVNRLLGGGIKGTNDEMMTYIVCYTSGFLICDIIIKLRFKSMRHISALIHHMIHVFAMISGLYTHVAHSTHFYLHGEELSTIPLSLRTLFYHQNRLRDVFDYLFVITFILCRLIYGTIICWYSLGVVPIFIKMASNVHDTTSIVFCLMQVILCILTRILNIYWTVLIGHKIWSLIQNSKQSTSVNIKDRIKKNH